MPDSTVLGFDGEIRIRFDEPVNVEQGNFLRQLIASPLEIYRLEKGFSDVRLQPRDGWRDSVMYCLEIPAGIRDLLNNQTEVGTAFCFSTGAPFTDAVVTGTVLDAETGQPEAGASVVFLTPPDSVPYGALTDNEGRFELRSLPDGNYAAFGFLDQNQNLRLDRLLEPYDSARVASFDGARPDLLFRVVEPDTTPPRLLRGEAHDSFTVQLEFDDALIRPQAGSPTVTISDSTRDIEIFEVRVGEATQMAFPGAPGTPADTAGAVEDTTAAADPAAADPAVSGDSLQAPVATVTPDELPSRFVTVRLAEAIASGEYAVSAEGFVNLRNLTGGGDTTFVADVPAPAGAGAAVDSLPADSLAADSLAADTLRADTLTADTVAADTAVVDTASIDTVSADTASVATGAVRGMDALTLRILRGWNR